MPAVDHHAIDAIQRLRDTAVGIKLRGLCLACAGWTRKRIAEALGKRPRTSQQWVGDDNHHGLDGLKDRLTRGRHPTLTLIPCRRIARNSTLSTTSGMTCTATTGPTAHSRSATPREKPAAKPGKPHASTPALSKPPADADTSKDKNSEQDA